MTKLKANTANTGISLPVSGSRKYNKNTVQNDPDFNAIFQYVIRCGILTVDDAIGLSKEAIMKTLIDHVHPYDIYQNKKDGRWVTYVPDPTKPSGRRDVKRKSKTDLYRYLISFYNMDISGSQAVDIPFEELYRKWVEYKSQFIGAANSKKSLSPMTIRRYELDYDNYIAGTEFAQKSISSITTTDLESFLLQIITEHQMSDTCAGNVIGYFNQVFAFARRSRYLAENPMDLIDRTLLLAKCTVVPPKPDKDRILTMKEFASLRRVLQEQESKCPGYMPNYAVELATLTGMRVGELAALKWSCVDDIYIHIDFSEHRLDYKGKPTEYIVGEPKNRKHRLIPITPELRKLFKRIEADAPAEKGEYVFVDKNGERCTAKSISLAASRRCKNAGIEHGSIHRIRRTVSSLLNQELPQKVVADLLGHTETVNELCYNYSLAETSEKVTALNHLANIASICEPKTEKTG